MAKYTIELYKLVENENIEDFKLFDFEYELYDNDLKQEFEKYFIDYFYFREIGHPTVGRFKKMLQNKLNTIAYYYKQYYKTCVEVETRNFMNTKEITETTTRELTGNNDTTSTNNSNFTNTDNTETNNTTETENTNIFSRTPKGSIENLEHYMSEGTITRDNATNNSTSQSTSENQQNSTSTSNATNKLTELLTFKSEGNLGVSSDGFLIDKWREIIVNINYKICSEELSELFMQIY